MAIGVYRLYVSLPMARSADLARLVAMLDSQPGFLYRLDHVATEDLLGLAENPGAVKSAIRVAVTQSHLVLVDPDDLAAREAVARLEIGLARSGFRRPIPVLGISFRDGTAASQADSSSMDRIVGLDAHQIANAIQDLAETAVAERRAADRRSIAPPVRAAQTRSLPVADADTSAQPHATRALPLDDIVEALRLLRARRVETQRPV